jgi:hypothetical protein
MIRSRLPPEKPRTSEAEVRATRSMIIRRAGLAGEADLAAGVAAVNSRYELTAGLCLRQKKARGQKGSDRGYQCVYHSDKKY